MSGFVVPMILGKGKVLFISNLIYSRFSEIANYPSGSAIAVAMLFLSLVIIYGITFVANRLYKG
jgi:putative spermidine/putrescine transport system permease protein